MNSSLKRHGCWPPSLHHSTLDLLYLPYTISKVEQQHLTDIYKGLIAFVIAAASFLAGRGKRKADKDNVITEAANRIVKSTIEIGKYSDQRYAQLNKEFTELKEVFEALNNSFSLREKQHKLTVEKLTLENRNLRLENEKLQLQIDSLSNANIRKLNG